MQLKAKTIILEGDPKDRICRAVEEMNINLLVVGSRGLGQIKRYVNRYFIYIFIYLFKMMMNIICIVVAGRFWEVWAITAHNMRNVRFS